MPWYIVINYKDVVKTHVWSITNVATAIQNHLLQTQLQQAKMVIPVINIACLVMERLRHPYLEETSMI